MDAAAVERDGLRFSYRNRDEFERIYRDVFGSDEYAFATRDPAPFIVDAGAHVGVATLYFKRRHPGARIVAFEPNPDTFAVLERNIRQNRLDGVRAVRAAIAPAPGEIPFYASADPAAAWSWGDAAIRHDWHGAATTRTIAVPAVTLSSVLDRPVDLLKLDVEGLEGAVLAEAAPRLGLVDRLVLEFHGSRRNPANDLDALLALLRSAGFAYHVQQDGRVVDERRIRRDEPYWLTIRAWRPGRFERLVRFLRERGRPRR